MEMAHVFALFNGIVNKNLVEQLSNKDPAKRNLLPIVIAVWNAVALLKAIVLEPCLDRAMESSGGCQQRVEEGVDDRGISHCGGACRRVSVINYC